MNPPDKSRPTPSYDIRNQRGGVRYDEGSEPGWPIFGGRTSPSSGRSPKLEREGHISVLSSIRVLRTPVSPKAHAHDHSPTGQCSTDTSDIGKSAGFPVASVAPIANDAAAMRQSV